MTVPASDVQKSTAIVRKGMGGRSGSVVSPVRILITVRLLRSRCQRKLKEQRAIHNRATACFAPGGGIFKNQI